MTTPPMPWPDTHDVRQATRNGEGWPRHRARKRNRKGRKAQRGRNTR